VNGRPKVTLKMWHTVDRLFAAWREEGREAAAYLILDQELDTLNRSSSSFRNGGSDTTHYDKVSVLSIEADSTRLTQEIYHEARNMSLACIKDVLRKSCEDRDPNPMLKHCRTPRIEEIDSKLDRAVQY
jgi:hypothetical protein